ncbi:MAG: UDP-4-amino-4,6-dideoxy-N-acetyl-beta-L-altrosamine transaminase [Cyclobacteriaceae bacterium]
MSEKPIPYGRQEITQSDIEAVQNVLTGDFLTQGPAIGSFEQAFQKYIGSNHAVAVSSGTSALHLAVMALGLKPGEKVITTPLTFSASANCVLYCGGEIVFADIDPKTGLIDFAEVEKIVAQQEIKGIIPVDYAGLPCNTEKLRNIVSEKDIWILEDACHAPGGWFENESGQKKMAGSCEFTDAAIFSFHPVKHIAAGEGGMVTVGSEMLKDRLETLRTHGITKSHLKNNDATPWYYEMLELGYNYRLTDIHAALARNQLSRANDNLSRRKEIAKVYDNELKGLPVELPDSFAGHAYHLYVIRTDQRDELYHHLHKHNIKAQVHYVPVHWMPFYQEKGWKKGQFPHSENFYYKCLSLPMFPSLADNELAYTIDTIKSFFQ